MGVTGLTEDDEVLLTSVVLNRAMLKECDGSSPPFLKVGQSLWAWFGWKSEQELRDYQTRLLSLVEKRPKVKRALSQKDWYIQWHEDKFYLEYRKSPPERLLAAVADGLIRIVTTKHYRWLIVGLLVGATVVLASLEPLLFHKLLAFVLTFCFYWIVVTGSSLWAFSRFVRPLDLDGRSVTGPWSRAHVVLLSCVLLSAVIFSLIIASLLTAGVRVDSNPYNEDVEQTYPW